MNLQLLPYSPGSIDTSFCYSNTRKKSSQPTSSYQQCTSAREERIFRMKNGPTVWASGIPWASMVSILVGKKDIAIGYMIV